MSVDVILDLLVGEDSQSKYRVHWGDSVVPRHRGIDQLAHYSSAGSSDCGTSSLIDLATPGVRAMSPRRSSSITIRWTVGGVTSKKPCMSASAGALRFSFM